MSDFCKCIDCDGACGCQDCTQCRGGCDDCLGCMERWADELAEIPETLAAFKSEIVAQTEKHARKPSPERIAVIAKMRMAAAAVEGRSS